MKSSYFLAIALLCWVLYGVLFIFPRKRKLLKRLGLDKTNDDLIRAAAQGDAEAAKLHRDSVVYVAVGVAIGLALVASRFF